MSRIRVYNLENGCVLPLKAQRLMEESERLCFSLPEFRGSDIVAEGPARQVDGSWFIGSEAERVVGLEEGLDFP